MSSKTVKDFMKIVKKKKSNAIKEIEKEDLFDLFEEEKEKEDFFKIPEEAKKLASRKQAKELALLNSSVNTKIVQDILTDKIVKYLNKNDVIEICYLEAFLQTVESVNFYQGCMKRTINNSKSLTFDEKIVALKQTAQNLSYHTTEPITIRLPEDPIVSIYRMKMYLEKYNASVITMSILNEYIFEITGKKYSQRKAAVYDKQEDKINKIKIDNMIYKEQKPLSELYYFTTK